MTDEVKTYLEYLARKRYLGALKIKDELGSKEVLDVGCSTGYGTAMLDAIGVDINHRLLARAKRRGLEVIRCDVQHLPFRSASFSMVTCFEVIEHVNRPRLVLNDIFESLKLGGTMVLTTPNKNFLKIDRLLVRKKKGSYPVREYNAKEMKTIIEDTGFIGVRMSGLGAWIPDFLVRMVPKLSEHLGRMRLNYTFSCIATKLGGENG